MPINLAVFASGKGSNTKNICSYFSDSSDINVSLICSSSLSSGVVDYAKKTGVPSFVFSKKELVDFVALQDVLNSYCIDLIILAGFLLKIPEKLIFCYPNKIINIHPSLLPKHGGKGMFGKNVHKAVIDSGEKESGISIHFVNNKYDDGRLIFQKSCPVSSDETVDSLEKKIQLLEHVFFPKIIKQISLSL